MEKLEKKPRLRAPNFTQSDNLLLCDLVSKYKHAIENKKTDGASLLEKQKAWLEVEDEYNAITTGCSRTVESLQQTYKNLKKRAKKKASDEKMDIPVDPSLVLNIEECGTSSNGCDWGTAPNTSASEDAGDELFAALRKTIMGTCTGSTSQDMQDTQDHVDGQDNETYYANNSASCKRKSETEMKLTNSDKFKLLATEQMDFLEIQKDLVKTQLQEEQDKVEHNRMLRAMEVEDAKKKYIHNEKLREMEIQEMTRRNEFNEAVRQIQLRQRVQSADPTRVGGDWGTANGPLFHDTSISKDESL